MLSRRRERPAAHASDGALPARASVASHVEEESDHSAWSVSEALPACGEGIEDEHVERDDQDVPEWIRVRVVGEERRLLHGIDADADDRKPASPACPGE